MDYFLSKQAVELPILLMLPLMENAIMFWAIGFRQGTFWHFALVYVLTVQCGTSIGYFISASFENMMNAVQIIPFAIMPSVLFAGLICNIGTMFTWIKWMSWTSPTRFAFEALIWAQYPNGEYGIAAQLDLELGYWYSVCWLAGWALLYKICTFLALWIMSRSGFN